MSAELGEILKYKFPESEIMDPNLKNKRLYITIYKANLVANIKQVITDGLEKATEIKNDFNANEKGVVDSLVDVYTKIAKENNEFHGKEKFTIVLPMPNELSDSQDHEFSVETGIAKSLISKIPGYETADNVIGKLASNMSKQRVLANPGYFQNYTGSKPRSFSFTFKLIPNSESEAKTIIDIILALKKYSSPDLSLNAFLEAPHFFNIWFSNETLMRLTGIRPCVITNVSTNYAGSGILDLTMDGMPKQIDLKIDISELRTLTASKWQE